ncbi:hypothetical protein [Nocardioides alkalitolerans]|uniref:hypothetical protein n=1 Tax=Nocardioides alkalitolerans TaxID=281714 RepID=UPI00040EB211|nr:hypothetical protein [Nocardioides alkalitolerans]
MRIRTVTGTVAQDPEEVPDAPRGASVRFTVVERTGAYLRGDWVAHPTPTTHHVEVPFPLSTAAASTLARGTEVILVGKEHTELRAAGGAQVEVRMVRADYLGVLLSAGQRVSVEPTGTTGSWWPADY